MSDETQKPNVTDTPVKKEPNSPASDSGGSGAVDLNQSMEECLQALNLFLNNKFGEALTHLQPRSDHSMYHALGYGTILYIQATMTFDAGDISRAVEVCKRSVEVCDSFRKHRGFFSSFVAADYNTYTVEQLHAELCYAESQIERALLTFIQDENLMSFIKGSLRIRSCYNAYKECVKMLEKRQWVQGDQQYNHFLAGVNMGMGVFELMISQLPTRILKLLEFIGFSGNKEEGLRRLLEGSDMDSTLRGPLCALVLIAYHTIVTYVLGAGNGDIDLSDRLLQKYLTHYPQGAMFLFFQGRVEEIKGNIEAGIHKFQESIACQQEWKQLHHLCYWEMCWSHSFLGEWLVAVKYADELIQESRWSKATYTYMKACYLLMSQSELTSSPADQGHEDQINRLLRDVPKLKQRIAGKSIPVEKFAVKKSERYFAQGNRLCLSAYEFMYSWNAFVILNKCGDRMERVLQEINRALKSTITNKDSLPFYSDDLALAMMLKGVCLRCQGKLVEAKDCFTTILKMDKDIKEDVYILPYSMLEMAMILVEEQEYELAKKTLEQAKSDYKNYSLESRLHFRVHALNLRIKSITRLAIDQPVNSNVDSSSQPSTVPSSPNQPHSPAPTAEKCQVM